MIIPIGFEQCFLVMLYNVFPTFVSVKEIPYVTFQMKLKLLGNNFLCC